MFTSLLVASLSRPADPDPKAELAKFQGDWVLVSGAIDGKPVPDEHVKKGRITWDGPKATIVNTQQSPDPITATVVLKPAGKGGTMDWTRQKGPGAGVVMLALYEWDGADSYKVCFDPTGKERPKTTDSKAGTGHIANVWKRAKQP